MLTDLLLASLAGLVALLLAIVTGASYARSRHPRLLLVTLGLLVFAAKGAWEAAALLRPDKLSLPSLTLTLLADLLIAGLLYAALLRPTRG